MKVCYDDDDFWKDMAPKMYVRGNRQDASRDIDTMQRPPCGHCLQAAGS